MSSPLHLRFLRRAQRRWTVWRSLECGGIAAAIGAIIALVIVGLLAWRGEPALNVAIILPAVAAAVGIVWGIHRRPTLTQTAILTDQQLKLHDLLSTTLLAESWADRAFCETVFAEAQAVCIHRSPNELIVRRLDGRAWSGIAILSAVVLTIALMSNEAGMRVAQAQTDSQSSALPWIGTLNGVDGSPRSDAESQTISLPAHSHQPDESKQNASAGIAQDREENTQTSDVSPSKGTGDTHQVKVDAMGEREGNTADAQVPAIANPNAHASETLSDGTLSAGGSNVGSALVDPNNTQQSLDKVTGANSRVRAPNWQAATPTADHHQYENEIPTGPVPDRYRDLVQEYFSRQN